MQIIKLKILAIIVILFCIGSCQMFFGEDDELTMKREHYMGTELNLNGYYYLKSNSGEMVYIYFIYRNGLILNAGACNVDKWENEEQNFLNEVYINKVVSLKYNWGVFHIKEGNIKFEKWYPSERPYRTGIREGKILNDSTFVITKVISSKGKEIVKDEVYHFKEFSPKIDSISKYIN